jgi:hypothetical protein
VTPRGILLLAAVLAPPPPTATPSDPTAIHDQAVKAYQAKDFQRFLELEKKASALDPENPRYQYNVACGEALAGHAAQAVAALDRLLERKLDLGAETDADFAAIRGSPQWRKYLEGLARLRRPLAISGVALTLPDPELLVCGLAIDAASGDLFIGSLRERKILRRGATGTITDFVPEGRDGLLGVGSLAIDGPRRLLYASATGAPHARGLAKEEVRRSGLFAFDLATGRLVRKDLLAEDGAVHALNNLAIDRSGNVYVSDSAAPGVYRWSAAAARLERFAPADVLPSTQGLALSPDETMLYVSDWSRGLWSVDLAAGAARKLSSPPGVWLGGLDGLTRFGDALVSVQIGVRPERVLELKLDAKGERVASARILEMSRPDYDGPIQGIADGESFLYIANSQLALVDPKSGAFAAQRARPTILLRLPFSRSDAGR